MTRIELCEVGPRDGLQNEATVLSPVVRAQLARRLAEAALPVVEAVSFVRDDLVPAMAAAEEVVAALPHVTDATFAGVVLNERGYDRLRATGLREAHASIGVTESFQRRNAGSSVADGIERVRRIVERARADGIRVTVTLSCAFGCPYEGRVEPAVVGRLAEMAGEAGPDLVVLADTIGVATPTRVRDLVRGVQRAAATPVGAHLHDTRGTAVACALAAVEVGATTLDASVGGLGGCPFAPGAQGNVATEDLVYALEGEGIETGVDLEALIAVARWLEDLIGRPLPGRVHRAGTWPG